MKHQLTEKHYWIFDVNTNGSTIIRVKNERDHTVEYFNADDLLEMGIDSSCTIDEITTLLEG